MSDDSTRQDTQSGSDNTGDGGGHSGNEERTSSGTSSGPTTGTTGTGIAADETGYGETGSLPDTAAPPVAEPSS